MSDKWAYIHRGRLAQHDHWEWFGPTAAEDTMMSTVYHPAMEQIYNDRTTNEHIITFDGRNWVTGHIAMPSKFLDPARFPDAEKLYDRELSGGRRVHHLHGFKSESADFPEQIPFIGRKAAGQLHEEKIVPLWKKSIDHPGSSYDRISPKTVTAFETVPTVGIETHLPQEAIEKLKAAHRERKPIQVQYDPASKQWFENKDFARNLERQQKEKAEQVAKNSSAEKAGASASETKGSLKVTAEEAEKSARSWVGRVWEKPSGKFAVIAGTVTLLSVAGYWAFHARQDKSVQQAAAK